MLKVRSNIEIRTLFSFAEVGYLEAVCLELVKHRRIDDFDLYIYYKRTQETDFRLTGLSRNTILFIVGDESNYLPVTIPRNVFAVFKAYLQDDMKYPNVFHLPVGFNSRTPQLPIIPITKRGINVFFSGNLHIGRAALYKHFVRVSFLPFSVLHRSRYLLGENFSSRYSASQIRFTRKFATGLSAGSYSGNLANTKIALCPPGNPGIETMRHFEAMRAGCIIISERLPAVDCYKGSPFVIVKEWKEIDEIVPELLNDPSKLEMLHRATLNWWEQKCSPQATAKYIWEKIDQLTSVAQT